MRRLTTVAAAVLAVVALAACAGDDEPAVTTALTEQELTAGEVTVKVAPKAVDDEGAEFAVSFDTHSVELDLDVAAQATLTVDGIVWGDPAWEGDGPSGHHREGMLRFNPRGGAAGQVVLTIGGLEMPATARWTLPEGG